MWRIWKTKYSKKVGDLMAKYILGLEIGNSNIKLLECKKQGTQMTIEKSQIIPTPEGVILDGMIENVQAVYEVINKEIKGRKYKSRNIVTVIKSSEIITRDIRMDPMPKKDMDAILALQYQEHLLVDISQYQVTYKIVKQMGRTEEDEQELLIVAAPNTIIYPLLEVARKLKMKMKSINIASDAITNLFFQQNSAMSMEEEEVMVIDIGGKSTTVTIVCGGVGVLNRDIPFGLDAINPLITREFGVENTEDIERFKVKHAGIYEEDLERDPQGQYISSILKPMMEYQLISEIRRFLQFHFSRSKNNSIEKIHIVGGGAYLKNIDQYFSNILGIPCLLGIELDLIKMNDHDEFKDKGAYFANILGLVSEFWG